jgi:PKHD-type hydroxylase
MTNTDSNFTDAAVDAAKKTASLEIMSINKSVLFSTEDCKDILSTCVEELWLQSTVIGDSNLHQSKRQKLRGDTAGFPFLNIREVTKSANDEIYDFSLLGIIDQDFPQVFKYSEGDYYKMHLELNLMAPSRKITFIINLNDPNEYEGGDIEFLNINADSSLLKEQGSCLIFPSYIPYSITPITKGNKYVLVGHIHGALFK